MSMRSSAAVRACAGLKLAPLVRLGILSDLVDECKGLQVTFSLKGGLECRLDAGRASRIMAILVELEGNDINGEGGKVA